MKLFGQLSAASRACATLRQQLRQQTVVGLAAALASVTVGAMPSAAQASDLLSCNWQASAGAGSSVRGKQLEIRVSALERPAPRKVTCWVALSSSAPTLVRGTHRGAVTEGGWSFAFQFPDGTVRQMYRGSQEGSFSFPVPLSGSNTRRLGIVIGIPGANPGYLRLEDLRLEQPPLVRPSPPRLLWPADNSQLTSPAADFSWATPGSWDTTAYEIEWQRPGSTGQRLRLPCFFPSDAVRVAAPTWLTPGDYQWRVRAMGIGGEREPWSAWKRFQVLPEPRKRIPDLHPSAVNPLFLIDIETEDPRPLRQAFPEELWPQLLFRFGGSAEQIQKTLDSAREANIALAVQVNGPHDIISGRWDRLPLAELEQWTEQYPNLKAFYICEQAVQGGISNPEVRDYLKRLIELGAEWGRPVLWADANWGRNVWLEVVADAEFSSFLRNHLGYVFPLWKMNGGFVPYLAPAGLLGLWLEQTVSVWGVQPESWYWVEAGFGPVGTQRDFKEGTRSDAPAVLYQQLALLGASAGAALFSFEPGVDFWAQDRSSADNLHSILMPLLVLLEEILPSKEEVENAIIRWHALEPGDLTFRKGYTAGLRGLFRQTLGLSYPFEEIPESGDCYWIPFVRGASPRGSRVKPARDHRPCPAPRADRGAVFRAGSSVFVLNSRVNWPERQSFSFSLAGLDLSGSVGLNGWLVAHALRPGEDGIWFYGRPPVQVELEFDSPVYWAEVTRNPGAARGAEVGAGPRWSTVATNRLEIDAQQEPKGILVRAASNRP